MTRVAVVMGGSPSEHDVSLRSGAEVLAHLPGSSEDRYGVIWRRNGSWEVPAGSDPVDAPEALRLLAAADVVFLALHGPGGEDGVVQGFLETAGIAYTGSGVASSAQCMNKAVAKAVVALAGLDVAPHALLTRAGCAVGAAGAAGEIIGYPCIVKPLGAGSSAGLRVADDRDELEAAVAELSNHWPSVMVEAFVSGPEVTGAVVEDGRTGEARVLPLIEIRHEGRRVFDPEAKYVPGVAEEICPAPLDEVVAGRVRDAALAAHVALGCRGFSRSDFILADGRPVYLETNTIPGLTRESLLPRAARAAGLSMTDLLAALVRRALSAREDS